MREEGASLLAKSILPKGERRAPDFYLEDSSPTVREGVSPGFLRKNALPYGRTTAVLCQGEHPETGATVTTPSLTVGVGLGASLPVQFGQQFLVQLRIEWLE